jgi:predicted nucleic-acid-binding Zn-ribbon protein
VECLRCKSEMNFLKEYKFESQDQNRGLLSALFDVEEHLIFEVYVCPDCRHTEFFYSGRSKWLDD